MTVDDFTVVITEFKPKPKKEKKNANNNNKSIKNGGVSGPGNADPDQEKNSSNGKAESGDQVKGGHIQNGNSLGDTRTS